MNRTVVVLVTLGVLGGCIAQDAEDGIESLEALASMSAEVRHDALAQASLEAAATVPECPGVPFSGIEDYAGLTGYYTRSFPHPADELVTLRVLTIEQVPEWIGVRGEYRALVRRDGTYGVEAARYLAVPNNPAIGPVIGFDLDRDDSIDELYWVLGATRNAFGRIDRLCLGKSRDDGSGAPFLLSRLGW